MWLYRGVQSAVFYYISCTPCGDYHYRRKRRRDAARTVREPSREGVVTDQPTVFHQPFPFTTNTYWSEEIALGPGPPSRRNRNGASRTGSQRNLSSPVPPAHPAETPDTLPSAKKDKEPLKNSIGDAWNRIRYQREDEVLWGLELKGSSIGLSGRGRGASDEDRSSKYYIARNPEVNDLHPPVACGPRSKTETKWMRQPPPSAKVMAGKVRSDTVREHRRTSGRNRALANLDLLEDDEPPNNVTFTSPVYDSQIPRHLTLADKKKPVRRPRDSSSPSPPSKDSSRLNSHSRASRKPLSTISSGSNLVPSSENLESLSRSSSPLSRQLDPIRPPPPVLLRKTATTHAEDRPSTNGTTDSGKAFHLRSPLPSKWGNHTPTNTHNNNHIKSHLGLSLHFALDDSSDEYSDFDDLKHVRPYRWSMDI
ncbi:hypothetical protein LOY97_006265 [Ophidiomyces ophidiicola]|nr:hypothetical protein LOZ49_006506 [Ophidiomyces ophidiicola]KAI2011241.1 hypothetical protein LOZ46_006178 [Ophidiomyces ophidiicola]KAI2130795.1 hypothetical protein LOZ29_005655 [Ophidiomyces ophidiicola]KAI2133395.1 hypothetical protein LOZ28_005422 [Ophidiomyces ophidiicola]KAI2211337.1 hypothetical protein LOZ15_005732 [Ophidiomyces ophidiicola]